MDLDQRAVPAICIVAYLMLGERPTEEPFGFLGTHVDTAMAHRHTEVLMPVGTVEGMSLRREETGPGHARELVVVGVGEEIAVAHVLGGIFLQDAEFALGGLGRKP